jgi:xanthine dehydrogenase YagS FAD-binding subunit
MNSFDYVTPGSVDDAIAVLEREEGARLFAGGTDLLGEMKRGIAAPKCVLNLNSVPELDRIRMEADGTLAIGALTKLSDLATHPVVREHHPLVSQAAGKAGTPQVRNVATLGGNLCQRPRCMYFRHPNYSCVRSDGKGCFAPGGQNRYHAIFGGHGCFMAHPSDLAPALIACDAEVVIAGKSGTQGVPMGEFFMPSHEDSSRETILESAEIVTEVRVPPVPKGTAGVFLKASERKTTDFALVSVAVSVTLEDARVNRARIVLGGVAPVPWRTPWAEECLLGEPLSDVAIRSACEAAVDDAKPLRENGYKIALVKGLLKKALEGGAV